MVKMRDSAFEAVEDWGDSVTINKLVVIKLVKIQTLQIKVIFLAWNNCHFLLDMSTKKALHFVFKVGNRTETAKFFREILGMKVSWHVDWVRIRNNSDKNQLCNVLASMRKERPKTFKAILSGITFETNAILSKD